MYFEYIKSYFQCLVFKGVLYFGKAKTSWITLVVVYPEYEFKLHIKIAYIQIFGLPSHLSDCNIW